MAGVKGMHRKRKEKPKSPKKGGRPFKFNPEICRKICNYVRMGSWLEIAAQAVGIHRETLRLWMKVGYAYNDADEHGLPKDYHKAPYGKFVKDLERAHAEAETLDLARIDIAANQVWQAAAWKLERRHPDRYSLKQKTELSGPNGGPLTQVSVTANANLTLTQDDLAKLPSDALEHLMQLVNSRRDETPALPALADAPATGPSPSSK